MLHFPLPLREQTFSGPYMHAHAQIPPLSPLSPAPSGRCLGKLDTDELGSSFLVDSFPQKPLGILYTQVLLLWFSLGDTMLIFILCNDSSMKMCPRLPVIDKGEIAMEAFDLPYLSH